MKISKKRETISQIPCSNTIFKDTELQASKKEKIVVDKSTEEKDMENNGGDSFSEKKSNGKPFDQDF